MSGTCANSCTEVDSNMIILITIIIKITNKHLFWNTIPDAKHTFHIIVTKHFRIPLPKAFTYHRHHKTKVLHWPYLTTKTNVHVALFLNLWQMMRRNYLTRTETSRGTLLHSFVLYLRSATVTSQFSGEKPLLLELLQGTLRSCALSDAVIASNPFESAFPKHLHCYTHTPTIGQLLWFPEIQWNVMEHSTWTSQSPPFVHSLATSKLLGNENVNINILEGEAANNRTRCYAHILRSNKDSTPKKVLNVKLKWKHRPGRQKSRWKQQVRKAVTWKEGHGKKLRRAAWGRQRYMERPGS